MAQPAGNQVEVNVSKQLLRDNQALMMLTAKKDLANHYLTARNHQLEQELINAQAKAEKLSEDLRSAQERILALEKAAEGGTKKK